MTHLPSLRPGTTLLEVMRAHPGTSQPLLDLHEAVMRGPSSLSVAERELLAAYVSGLNDCSYCYGVHRVTAATFGVDEDLLTALLTDVDRADVDHKLRPLLHFVHRLTLTPSRVTPSDAQSVLDAGWDEGALHDAVSVCGLFSLMNRYVDGLGVAADSEYLDMSGRRLAEDGYAGLKNLL